MGRIFPAHSQAKGEHIVAFHQGAGLVLWDCPISTGQSSLRFNDIENVIIY